MQGRPRSLRFLLQSIQVLHAGSCKECALQQECMQSRKEAWNSCGLAYVDSLQLLLYLSKLQSVNIAWGPGCLTSKAEVMQCAEVSDTQNYNKVVLWFRKYLDLIPACQILKSRFWVMVSGKEGWPLQWVTLKTSCCLRVSPAAIALQNLGSAGSGDVKIQSVINWQQFLPGWHLRSCENKLYSKSFRYRRHRKSLDADLNRCSGREDNLKLSKEGVLYCWAARSQDEPGNAQTWRWVSFRGLFQGLSYRQGPFSTCMVETTRCISSNKRIAKSVA